MMAAAMVLALAFDALLGWPDRLYQRIGHPVTWLGRVISWADTRFNREDQSAHTRRRNGRIVAWAIIIAVAALAWGLSALLPGGLAGLICTGLLAWPLVAAKSLHDHVAAVAEPLRVGDLDTARHAISMIVGRDPDQLDAPAISRAALESLAENASDGVIAPLFWGALLGLPGIAVYKAINTMDSMIGYKTPRHVDFGRAAALIDDWANWLPARLTGLLIAWASKARGTAIRTMRRDARGHRSPNAGWPEAAMAGALAIRLSGPRRYAEGMSDDPFLNPVGSDPTPDDLFRGLRLFRRAVGLAAIGLALWAVLL
ncbi:MAG: adenosylcobinamide-phosphate synthase CbiB [Silicimonas sp.]|nr:adenosylcobinamide-phosphate synthase CbiB [Silicimonas sp.]